MSVVSKGELQISCEKVKFLLIICNTWNKTFPVHVDVVQAETVTIKLQVISKDTVQEDGGDSTSGQCTCTCTNQCLFGFRDFSVFSLIETLDGILMVNLAFILIMADLPIALISPSNIMET